MIEFLHTRRKQHTTGEVTGFPRRTFLAGLAGVGMLALDACVPPLPVDTDYEPKVEIQKIRNNLELRANDLGQSLTSLFEEKSGDTTLVMSDTTKAALHLTDVQGIVVESPTMKSYAFTMTKENGEHLVAGIDYKGTDTQNIFFTFGTEFQRTTYTISPYADGTVFEITTEQVGSDGAWYKSELSSTTLTGTELGYASISYDQAGQVIGAKGGSNTASYADYLLNLDLTFNPLLEQLDEFGIE